MSPCRLVPPILVAVLLGCATFDISTDYDPAVDFAALRTYDWFPEPPPPTEDPRIDSTLLQSRIRSAVDAELGARGYRKVSEAPDFLVAYQVALEKRLDVETIDGYYGPYWRAGPYWGGPVYRETIVREYEQGTLLLDFLDPRTKRLLWRGAAQARVIPEATPEERQARIREAVRLMLERFPPRPSS